MAMNTQVLLAAIEYILLSPPHVDGVDPELDAAWSVYDAEVTPSAIMGMASDYERLMADNDRLKAENDEPEWHLMMTRLEDHNVQLKAEVAGLKTGYEAYERVNAELKAEVELIRGLLREMRAIGNHAPAELTLRIDAAMSKGGRS
jgi:hypothetical protein